MQRHDDDAKASRPATGEQDRHPETASLVLARLDWRGNARPPATGGGLLRAAVAKPRCVACPDRHVETPCPETDATPSPCAKPRAVHQPENPIEARPPK